MKVSVQYAGSHLVELLPAPLGEVAGKPDEVPTHAGATPLTKRGLWGAGKGEIWMAEDWDSRETNEDIAVLFNEGPIFPGNPAE